MTESTPRRPRRPARQSPVDVSAENEVQDLVEAEIPEVTLEPTPEVEVDEVVPLGEPLIANEVESEPELAPETPDPFMSLPQVNVVTEVVADDMVEPDAADYPGGTDPDEPIEDDEPEATPVPKRSFGKRGGKSKSDKEPAEARTKVKRRWSPRTKSLVITSTVLVAIFGILGFSLYQVSQAPSTDDMAAVYIERSGDLGFPIDRGENAAQRFLSLYLTADSDSNVRRQTQDALQAMMVNGKVPTYPNEITQRIISGPTPAGLLIQESPIKASQRYTAIIETTRTIAQPAQFGEEPPAPEVTKEVSTVTYLVNLEANPETFEVAVRGNPTLIPNRPETKLPALPGETTDGPLSNEINTTLVTPFLQAWAASETPVIQKFLSTGASGQWTQGLGGTQVLKGANVTAPTSLKASREGQVRVEAQWESPWGEQQTSNYTMTVVFENGGWLLKDLY